MELSWSNDDLMKFNSAIYIDGDPKGGYSIPSKAELRNTSKLVEMYGHLGIRSVGKLAREDVVDKETMTHYVVFGNGLSFLLG